MLHRSIFPYSNMRFNINRLSLFCHNPIPFLWLVAQERRYNKYTTSDIVKCPKQQDIVVWAFDNVLRICYVFVLMSSHTP